MKRLLGSYDAALPAAVSDHLGDHNPVGFFLPSPLAAVCSPCHYLQLPRRRRRTALLAALSRPVASRDERAAWDPTDLDMWGYGRLKGGPVLGAQAAPGHASDAVGGELQGEGDEDDAGAEGDGGGAEGEGADGAGAEAEARRRALRARPGGGEAAGVNGVLSSLSTLRQQPARLLERATAKRLEAEQLNATAALAAAYYGATVEAPAAPALAAARPAPSAARPAAATAPLTPAPVPPPGCPCRPELACLHRARVCRGRGRGQELCGLASVWKPAFRGNGSVCRHSWGHGGAGVALSVGLLAATAGGPVEACCRSTHVHSCDMNLALCLMRAGRGGGGGNGGGAGAGGGNGTAAGGGGGGGFMFTHPGSAALHGAHWADPRFILFDNPVFPQVGAAKGRGGAGAAAVRAGAGACGRCRVALARLQRAPCCPAAHVPHVRAALPRGPAGGARPARLPQRRRHVRRARPQQGSSRGGGPVGRDLARRGAGERPGTAGCPGPQAAGAASCG